jgi:hypothetical protein
MKFKKIFLILITLSLATIISCQESKDEPQANTAKSSKSDLPSKGSKSLDKSRVYFAPGSAYNGINYRFYGVEWQVCSNNGTGSQTIPLQVGNSNYYGSLNNVTVYVATQSHVNLSANVPIGSFTFAHTRGDGFMVYKWTLSLFPGQVVFGQINTYMSSGPEGILEVYIPPTSQTSFCDGTKLNVVTNYSGRCNDSPNPPAPGC